MGAFGGIGGALGTEEGVFGQKFRAKKNVSGGPALEKLGLMKSTLV